MSCTRKIWAFAVIQKLKITYWTLFCALFLGGLTASATDVARTTTTLAVMSGGSAVTTVSAGSVVTLTATVTVGSSAVTTGQVNFCDASAAYCTDIHLLGTAQLTNTGTAVLRFVPGIGNHSYKAVFAGTTSGTTVNAASSSSASSLEVTGTYPTTTSIVQSGSAGNYLLTATVVGTGIQAFAPRGSVSFLDTNNANYALGTAPLGSSIVGLNFTNSPTPAVSSYPSGIAVGDFNGDGVNDLAIATVSTNAVQVLLGKGDGMFTTAASVAVGNEPNYIATGDLNNDGVPDLLVSSITDNTISVLLGNGDGTFTSGISHAGNGPIIVADFNGDGIADIAIVSIFSYQAGVLLGNGDGTFRQAGNTPLFSPSVNSMAAGDFNGDGVLDLATTNSVSSVVTLLLGNGDGMFNVSTNIVSAGPNAQSIATADFNADGKLDLTVANGGSTVAVLLGKGDGTFTAAASPTVGLFSSFVSVGDFNGDGIPDITVSEFAGGRVDVLLGIGDGTFLPMVSSPTGDQVVSLALGDFNGDGMSDVAVGDFSAVTVLLPQFTQTITATVNGVSPVGMGIHQVDASYEGDSNYGPSVSSTVGLMAQPVMTTLSLNANPSSILAGQQVALTATLSPYMAQGHSTDGETVTFYNGSSNLGTGTFAGGVATLNVTSLPVGTDSITAAFGGDANFSASTSTAFQIVVAPIPALLNISANTGILAISTPGGSATDSLQISSVGSFSGTVSLTCKVTYAGSGTANDLPVCSLNPQQGAVATGSPLISTLTLTTTGNSAKLNETGQHVEAVLATVFLFWLLPRRGWKGIRLFTLLVIVAACGAIGCGGGGSENSGTSNPGTTPGHYQVVVTASGSSLTTSTTIPLNLQ